MNDPPTALVGFHKAVPRRRRRLSMNDPPTALVGFQKAVPHRRCRLNMNDPPTALVGLSASEVRDVALLFSALLEVNQYDASVQAFTTAMQPPSGLSCRRASCASCRRRCLSV